MPRMFAHILAGMFPGMIGGLRVCGCVQVVHMDVKPANIYESPSGLLKLGDFGHARVRP